MFQLSYVQLFITLIGLFPLILYKAWCLLAAEIAIRTTFALTMWKYMVRISGNVFRLVVKHRLRLSRNPPTPKTIWPTQAAAPSSINFSSLVIEMKRKSSQPLKTLKPVAISINNGLNVQFHLVSGWRNYLCRTFFRIDRCCSSTSFLCFLMKFITSSTFLRYEESFK